MSCQHTEYQSLSWMGTHRGSSGQLQVHFGAPAVEEIRTPKPSQAPPGNMPYTCIFEILSVFTDSRGKLPFVSLLQLPPPTYPVFLKVSQHAYPGGSSYPVFYPGEVQQES